MAPSLFLEGGESTYNINAGVVQESNTLTTASQQYWAQRQAFAESQTARFTIGTSTSDAELVWRDFCAKGFSFLDRLLKSATERLERPLTDHWTGNRELARDAKQLFAANAVVEILIPYSRTPLCFVKLSPRSSTFEIRALSFSDSSESYELGKPYLGVSWKDVSLFAITPDSRCVEMDTFYINTPDGKKWPTTPVLTDVFTKVAKEFQAELDRVEANFRPYFELVSQRAQLEMAERSLFLINRSKEAWEHLHLPEPQKLEILRALELVENANPAAPRGLLLTGPSGVGKSLLGKTIADTAVCGFQHLTPASLKLDHLGGSGRKVRQIWEEARRSQPSILYLDECEGVLGRRGAAETDAISMEIVQAFLAEWDGLDKSTRVWVIGATNRCDLLDDAILSRFGWVVQIELPSEDERIGILHQELKSVGVEAPLSPEFGALTQGMSGRDLQEAAKTARRMAHPDMPSLDQIKQAINKMRKDRNTPISVLSKWENLVLDPKILGRMKLISGLLQNPAKWIAQGVSIPHTLLLEGPPGTGKTEIARTLANESGLAFHAATTADLKANYLGQSGNRVKQLFERARSHSPCILFLDELDIAAPDRSLGGDDPLTREIVGQLLQEMDGVRSYAEHLFVLGATNRSSGVDRAILSRFGEQLAIPLPDYAARIRLLSIFLEGKKLGFPLDSGAMLLADLSEGKNCSGRDLRNWVATAEQNALLRAMEEGGPESYLITLEDFS